MNQLSLLFLLSAKQEATLKKYLHDLVLWIEKNGSLENLSNMAFTLQVGREHFETRLAVFFRSGEELLTKLKSYLDGKIDLPSLNQLSQSDALDQEMQKSVLSWLNGTRINWKKFSSRNEKKIHIPPYPFDLKPTNYRTPEKSSKEERKFGYILPKWKLSPLSDSLKNLSDSLEEILCFCSDSVFQKIKNSKTAHIYLPEIIELQDLNVFIRVYEEIQTLLKRNKLNPIAIVFFSDQNNAVWNASFTSFLKTIKIEKPSVFVKMIEVQSLKDRSSSDLQTIFQNELNASDIHVRYEGFLRTVQKFEQSESLSVLNEKQSILRKDKVYLITGGLGRIARHLLTIFEKEKIPATIVLSGRSNISASQKKWLEQQNTSTLRVVYHSCDSADHQSVKALIKLCRLNYGELKGVIHTAGVLDDALIINKDLSDVQKVLMPKVLGAYNIDQLTQMDHLDYFILFSSDTSLFGNIGQGDYGAANGYLDQFAFYRNSLVVKNQRFGKTLTINWPYWKEGGMRLSDEHEKNLFRETGLKPLETQNALEGFKECIQSSFTQIMIYEGNKFEVHEKLLISPQQKGIKPSIQNSKIRIVNKTDIYNFLKGFLSSQLKIEISKIQNKTNFQDLGIESIQALELANKLEKRFEGISKTIFLEYGTVLELSEYLLKNYPEQWEESMLRETGISKEKDFYLQHETSQGSSSIGHDVAIVGISGIYPQARNLEELYLLLENKKDAISVIPKKRWDYEEFYSPEKQVSGKCRSKWGGFIDDVDCFDPLFFKISKKEADTIDPQERLALQQVWHALEDGGYSLSRLHRLTHGKVGIFVGSMYLDYHLNNPASKRLKDKRALNVSASSIANRISYFFDLNGPSLTLDTMCSSSVTAIYLACQSLHTGESSMAIVSSVNLSLHPHKYVMLGKDNFLSTDGKCRSFGDGGDGYVPSEGIGAVLLKPLHVAEKDGDRIHGVIKGVKINHGARSSGFTVPNARKQSELIRSVLEEAQVSSDQITYIEAHGTGTALGDPIEIQGLHNGLHYAQKLKATNKKIPVGSIKSNIGHCEASAGMAALSKLLLQFRYKKLLPSIHSEKLNSNIQWDTIPFYVPQQVEDWNVPHGFKRRALISSFGAGGSNAVMIVEEYFANKNQNPSDKNQIPKIFVLSAFNQERLKVYLQIYYDFLTHGDYLLEDLLYTLQIGREGLQQRIAILFDDINDLKAKVRDLLSEMTPTDSVFLGNISASKKIFRSLDLSEDLSELVESFIDKKKWAALAELWTMGVHVQWEKLYRNTNLSFVSLPTYPFQKVKCWFSEEIDDEKVKQPERFITSLVQEDLSTQNHKRFKSTFNGMEFFLAEHVIDKKKLLPGAVFAEMFLIAGELVHGKKAEGLKNISWQLPFIIEKNQMASVEIQFSGNENLLCTAYSMKKNIFSSAELVFENNVQRDSFDLSLLKSRCTEKISRKKFYEDFRLNGFEYGPNFQVIQEGYVGDREFLSYISLQSESPIMLHTNPILIDALFQSTALYTEPEFENCLFLPFLVESLSFFFTEEREGYVYGKLKNIDTKNDIFSYDIWFINSTGEVLIEIIGFKVKSKLNQANFKKDLSQTLISKEMREKEELSVDDALALLEL